MRSFTDPLVPIVCQVRVRPEPEAELSATAWCDSSAEVNLYRVQPLSTTIANFELWNQLHNERSRCVEPTNARNSHAVTVDTMRGIYLIACLLYFVYCFTEAAQLRIITMMAVCI